MFFFLLKVTLFLAKQNIPFRDHLETSNSHNEGNFIKLLQAFEDYRLNEKPNSRYGHYTIPEYRNDLIYIIAKCTRQNILRKINPLFLYYYG